MSKKYGLSLINELMSKYNLIVKDIYTYSDKSLSLSTIRSCLIGEIPISYKTGLVLASVLECDYYDIIWDQVSFHSRSVKGGLPIPQYYKMETIDDLKTFIAERGLILKKTQSQISKDMGLCPSYISALLTKQYTTTVGSLIALAKALQVDVSTFCVAYIKIIESINK